ncbi:MAG: hypothetical protein K2H64_12290 [Desulfovibrio sp.]|nr:hypothetical protein [Desulfovibrio sp.]
MAKDLCVIYANCQGEALLPLLRLSPDFDRLFDARLYTNYIREKIPARELEEAGLFLYQWLGEDWGEVSSESLLARAPDKARVLCIPNLFFKGYWPFWTDKTGVIEFEDSALEDLLARGLSPEAAQMLYSRGDPKILGDVEGLIAESMEREKRKEIFTPIKYTSIIEDRWREEQLFLTVNHPGSVLLSHVANSILKILGLPPLPPSSLAAYEHPQGDFLLPIHPAIGRMFNLGFASADRKYPCFGASVTHAEFVQYYLGCRAHGVRDLTGVLKNIAYKGK